MKDAIAQALSCVEDVPVGCVIKKDGHIIAATHNCRECYEDVTAHAEILSIKEAQRVLGTSRLLDCDMYVTLEPCPMCGWAILQSGIKNLYFGSYNPQYGAFESKLNLREIANSKIKVYGGIEEDTCNEILEKFFKRIR